MFCNAIAHLLARAFPHWRPPLWMVDPDGIHWSTFVSGLFALADVAVLIGIIGLVGALS